MCNTSVVLGCITLVLITCYLGVNRENLYISGNADTVG